MISNIELEKFKTVRNWLQAKRDSLDIQTFGVYHGQELSLDKSGLDGFVMFWSDTPKSARLAIMQQLQQEFSLFYQIEQEDMFKFSTHRHRLKISDSYSGVNIR